MAREISISFALTAALKGGFKAAFQGAAQQARSVTSAIRDMERSPVGKLGAAMISQREKIKGLSSSLKEARSTLAALNAQAAAGNSTGMLARQIELAERRVNNLSGAMQRQIGIWKTTAAEAATTGGSVRKLAQDYDHLSSKIERAKKTQAAINANRAQADALRSQRSDLNSRLAGAAMTAMTVAAPVKLSIDFEDQMARVGAVSRAEKDDLAALTAQARQLGRDTTFSASQAAQGMQYLAMAGFKTKQIMGAMPGMLDLAAASGSDLGRTADIASNILSAFGMKAEEMGTVGNVLTAAFTSSNTTLESLGETMKYVAPVAKDAGASLQEAAALAAVLGNVGISGSQAGTSAKAVYARLAAPPTEAADALRALNISTKDAQGNLRKVPEILEEIIGKTQTMGNADRAGIFKDIFGLESMAAASTLAKQAAQTIDENGNQIVDSAGKPTTALLKIIDAFNNCGDISQKVAQKMNDTTGGALRRLNSAWEDTSISIGNLFMPTIRTAADVLSGFSNVISGAIERFPNLSRGIALVTGGVAALAVGGVALGLVMNLVKTSLNAWRGALLRLSASQVTATVSTGAMSAATGIFGAASRLAGAGARFFAGGLRSILMATGVGALLVGLGYGISLLIDNWDSVVAAMSSAWGWVTDTWGKLGTFFSGLGDNLLAVLPGIKDDLYRAFEIAWAGVTGLWDDCVGFFSGLWDDIWSGVSAFAGRIGGVFSGIWSGIMSGVSNFGQWLSGYFSRLPDSIASIFIGVGYWISDTFTIACQRIMDVWNGITSFFSGIWAWITDSASALWDNITGAASWAYESVAAIWNGAVSFFDSIVGGICGAFTWAKDTVVGVWSSASDFFSGLWLDVTANFESAWNTITGLAASAFDSVTSVWNSATGYFSGIVSGISGIFDSLFGWLKNEFAWVFSAIDSVGSAIGKIKGAVSDAWNSVFGDDDDKAPAKNAEKASKESAAPAAGTAMNKPAAAGASNAVQKPVAVAAPKVIEKPSVQTTPQAQAHSPQKYKPVSSDDYYNARDSKKGKSGNGSKKSGSAGSRSGKAGGGAKDSGPVTIVKLAGDNSRPSTVFIPASQHGQSAAQNAEKSRNRNSAPNASNASGSAQTTAAHAVRIAASKPMALPQSPGLISKKSTQGKQDKAPTSINIDLKQNFELIAQDAVTVRKVLESIKPDMETLVRRALEKISSDRRRTAYAQ